MRMPWWRWVLATFVILSLWVYGSALITYALHAVPSTHPWQVLLHDLATFVPFLIATPLVWWYATRRPVAELINTRGRIDARRILHGFVAWFALSGLATLVDWRLHPGSYRGTFNASVFLPFALVTLVLLPVQSWAEELFFRGWILRWSTSLRLPAQVVLNGLVFALPHLGNPEASQQTLLAFGSWFLLGAGWAYASIRDGGIEVSMGAHLANNAFSLLLVGYDGAVLPTSAVFTTSSLDLSATFVSLVCVVPLFALVTRRGRRPQ